MRILIDIGHPAHVHYFRNFIKIMEKRGHEFLVVARNRGIIKELLDYYEIDFVDRGKGRDSFFGKLYYMLIADYRVYKYSKNFKPDLFLSFSSPYAAQISVILKKDHIALNDTEHSVKMFSIFTFPFTSSILTPESFKVDLGIKQIRFKSIVESLYLDKHFYLPNKAPIKELGVLDNEQYVVIRFVSWHAYHDYGEKGISIDMLRNLIGILEKKFKIFISSESKLPKEFLKYSIDISKHKIHDVLAYASLYIGESATMASECAYLGTPVVYINSLPLMGYLDLESKYNLLKYFNTTEHVISYVKELIEDPDLKRDSIVRSELMKENFINTTEFLVWFVENYPESKKIIKNNPDYQLKFKLFKS